MDCTVSTNVLPERRRGFALPQPRLRRSRRVSRDARTGCPTSPRFCSLSNRARGGPRRAIEREARARIRSAVVGVQTNRLLPTSTQLVGIVAQKRSETANTSAPVDEAVDVAQVAQLGYWAFLARGHGTTVTAGRHIRQFVSGGEDHRPPILEDDTMDVQVVHDGSQGTCALAWHTVGAYAHLP